MQIDISNNKCCEAALHSMHGYVEVLGNTSIKNSGEYEWTYADGTTETGEKKSVATMDWSENKAYAAGTQVEINTTGNLEGQIYSSAYKGDDQPPTKQSYTTIINANVIGDVVESEYVNENKYGVKFEIKGGQFNGKLTSESNPPMLSISAGAFTTSDVQKFMEDNATLAKVSFGGQTKYLAGEDVASQIQRLSSLSSVEVLQGDLTLSNLPGGVSVTNKGSGKVSANGQTVQKNESLQIPYQKPIAGVVVSGGEEEQPGGEEDGSQAAAPTYAVICRKLNVRSGPGTSYERIGSLSRGALLSGVLENGWLRFTYNGQTAYVSATYVQPLNGSGDLCVLCNALNVRTGPSTSYAKLGQLLSGTYVDPLESQNGWYKIGYNGGYGWICADYVG